MLLKLEEIANIQVGYQARSRIKEEKTGTHKLIQGRDFKTPYHLRYNNIMSFIPDINPELYEVKKGDILFLARGMEHFAYNIREDLSNTLAAGSFYIIRLRNGNILPSYLTWWINQNPAQNYFKTYAKSSRISFISIKTLSHLEIKIPEIAVQKDIEKIQILWNQEQELTKNLTDLRNRLIKSVCLKSVNIEGAK